MLALPRTTMSRKRPRRASSISDTLSGVAVGAWRRSLLAALPLALLACSSAPSSGELREWRPSDHQVPEGLDEAEASATAPPPDPGEALYATHCAGCHGAGGAGDGPEAPPMARVPSFDDPRIAALDDAAIGRAILEGRGGFMPSFRGRISPSGVEAIVRHVRRLVRAR